MKNNKGFALIELMIVVAIIAILAAVAIPKFADLVQKSQCSSLRKGSPRTPERVKACKSLALEGITWVNGKFVRGKKPGPKRNSAQRPRDVNLKTITADILGVSSELKFKSGEEVMIKGKREKKCLFDRYVKDGRVEIQCPTEVGMSGWQTVYVSEVVLEGS